MHYDFILALDPSGSFCEGKGTTGWCVFNCKDNKVIHAGSISAKKFDSMEAYWDAQINLIDYWRKRFKNNLLLVVEDYILYESKAMSQVHSHMETSKLLGVIQYYCFLNRIPYIMEPASVVKNRWSNKILLYKKYIKKYKKNFYIPLHKKEPIDRHCLDAIRHAVHVATFKNK